MGRARKKTIKTDGITYRIRELDPEHYNGTRVGAVGISECGDMFGGYTCFAVWGVAPQGNDFDVRPALIIKAGCGEAGEWAYGWGRKMKEEIRAEFPFTGLLIENPSTEVVVLALSRAIKRARAVDYKVFWEKDRYPGGDYRYSPR